MITIMIIAMAGCLCCFGIITATAMSDIENDTLLDLAIGAMCVCSAIVLIISISEGVWV